VLAGLGLVALERADVLPGSLAATVRQAERWLEPALEDLLSEAGLDLPSGRDQTAPRSRLPSPTSASEDEAAVAQALELFASIPIGPERPRGYDRESWPHWLDADGDCMDARHEVLLAESLVPAQLSADGCDIEGGLWRDAYTGETFRDPSALDVDHLVPLAEAHRSGGREWDRERRAAFANDLGDTRTLIAVSASANRSKGDQGPEEWLPSAAGYRCRYAADWVAVKARWRLSMDERERVTVGNLLSDCAAF
jgi:hypothetical protein